MISLCKKLSISKCFIKEYYYSQVLKKTIIIIIIIIYSFICLF